MLFYFEIAVLRVDLVQTNRKASIAMQRGFSLLFYANLC